MQTLYSGWRLPAYVHFSKKLILKFCKTRILIVDQTILHRLDGFIRPYLIVLSSIQLIQRDKPLHHKGLQERV